MAKRKCQTCHRLIEVVDGKFISHGDPLCTGTEPMKRKFSTDNYPTYDTSTGYGNPQEWQEAFKARFTDAEINTILEGKDPYTVLNVSRTATQEEVKTAYRNLAKQWHPDKNSAPDAEHQFKRINAAFQKLAKFVIAIILLFHRGH